MHKIVDFKIFGNRNAKTIYYFTGYGSTIKQMWLHIKILQLMGFRIVAFQYKKTILNSGNPSLIVDSIDYIFEIIKRDRLNHRISGIYGVSLGSFIGFNLLKRTDITKAIFNTGGVSVANTIWSKTALATEKDAYIRSGYCKKKLQEIWSDIDNIGDCGKDKEIILMISEGDEVLSPKESVANYKKWLRSGVDAELIVSKWLKHGPVIVCNLFRLSMTKKIFKKH